MRARFAGIAARAKRWPTPWRISPWSMPAKPKRITARLLRPSRAATNRNGLPRVCCGHQERQDQSGGRVRLACSTRRRAGSDLVRFLHGRLEPLSAQSGICPTRSCTRHGELPRALPEGRGNTRGVLGGTGRKGTVLVSEMGSRIRVESSVRKVVRRGIPLEYVSPFLKPEQF